MKKLLIVMAIVNAIFAPAVVAGVTVGGEMRYEITDDDSGTEFDNNGSILTVDGSEDLGDGLKAGFYTKITGIGGNSTIGSGNTYLNLSGSMGKIQFGQFHLPSKEVLKMAELHGDTAGKEVVFANTLEPNQQIQYATPSIGGVTVKVSVVSGDVDAGSGTDYELDGNVSNVAIYYDSGPLSVAYATLKGNDGTADATALGLKYTMDDLKLVAAYEDVEDAADATVIGASYNVGNGNSIAVTSQSQSLDVNEKNTIALNHAFSARTRAYLMFNHPKQGGNNSTVIGFKHKF